MWKEKINGGFPKPADFKIICRDCPETGSEIIRQNRFAGEIMRNHIEETKGKHQRFLLPSPASFIGNSSQQEAPSVEMEQPFA